MEAYHGTPYDLRSIMQYGKNTFRKASASGNVMESKEDPDAPISNNEMSDWDIIELNRRYQCEHVDENGKKHRASEHALYSFSSDLFFTSGNILIPCPSVLNLGKKSVTRFWVEEVFGQVKNSQVDFPSSFFRFASKVKKRKYV